MATVLGRGVARRRQLEEAAEKAFFGSGPVGSIEKYWL